MNFLNMGSIIPPQGNANIGQVVETATFTSKGSFAQKSGAITDIGFLGDIVPSNSDWPLPLGYIRGGTVKGDQNLTPSNIAAGVKIFNVNGTFTSDATATAADILAGKTAYVKGALIMGTGSGGGGGAIQYNTSNQNVILTLSSYTTKQADYAFSFNVAFAPNFVLIQNLDNRGITSPLYIKATATAFKDIAESLWLRSEGQNAGTEVKMKLVNVTFGANSVSGSVRIYSDDPEQGTITSDNQIHVNVIIGGM
ncbi:hypothetical protein [Paenibacillus hamazuiensis]|uniref:hypothetical protein n=1 Tax=Paenibacillus hamazuiensis TaxID=2936508 RepID=UPI002010192A|nr:hypothetical protein [Paenibacillus hamazuiensis]